VFDTVHYCFRFRHDVAGDNIDRQSGLSQRGQSLLGVRCFNNRVTIVPHIISGGVT